jgi:hypothetical protein
VSGLTDRLVTVTEIRSILHRRTDLSTFVVHLTRRRDESYGPQDALVDIARSGRLEARTALGWAKAQDDPDDATKQSQRVVCFSETPLEHVSLMLGAIQGRRIAMEPYGIALPKLRARKLGINPVWYVDQTGGADSHDWALSKTLDHLRDHVVAVSQEPDRDFHQSYLARIFPFMEQMGTWRTSAPKEFWWEREWRHVGHLTLPDTGLIWLCPEDEIDAINARLGRELGTWLDPRWGLEEIIAHLAGFSAADVSPFSQAPPLESGTPF